MKDIYKYGIWKYFWYTWHPIGVSWELVRSTKRCSETQKCIFLWALHVFLSMLVCLTLHICSVCSSQDELGVHNNVQYTQKSHFICTIWVGIGCLWTPRHPLGQTVHILCVCMAWWVPVIVTHTGIAEHAIASSFSLHPWSLSSAIADGDWAVGSAGQNSKTLTQCSQSGTVWIVINHHISFSPPPSPLPPPTTNNNNNTCVALWWVWLAIPPKINSSVEYQRKFLTWSDEGSLAGNFSW